MIVGPRPNLVKLLLFTSEIFILLIFPNKTQRKLLNNWHVTLGAKQSIFLLHLSYTFLIFIITLGKKPHLRIWFRPKYILGMPCIQLVIYFSNSLMQVQPIMLVLLAKLLSLV